MFLKIEDQQAVDQAVKKFLLAGIIEISPTQSRDYLSNFFTIQEATKRRPILDCKMINNYIQCSHFKMEGVPALREIIEKNDYICKIDLKDAYVVVPLHQKSRKIFDLSSSGHSLSIQDFGLRDECQPQSIQQDYALCDRAVGERRNTYDLLFGRHTVGGLIVPVFQHFLLLTL